MIVPRLFIILLSAAIIAGCGNNESASENEETMVEQPAEDLAPDAQTSPESTSAPLSVEDIDRWQRGMEAELQAVQEAEQSFNQAATSDDSLNAMMAANDMSTRSAGARAAGVSEDRYQFIRSTLSSAVKYMTPLEQEMDVSQMPESAIEQFEQSRQTSIDQMSDVLPDDVREALGARATELRRQDLQLTNARLAAVGMGL